MKSEKYLNRIFKPMSPIQNKVKAYDRDMVNKVIKIAEQEAEERMRKKAIKAFRHFVMEYHCKEASCPKREKCDSSCVISQYFIQKLTEE